MEEQLQLHKELREKQEKYAYYIIALCVTAIGFSVVKTTGQPLKISQIPLAIAVLAWAFSIYCGLKFIGIITASIYKNSMYLDIVQGRDPELGTNPKLIQIGVEAYQKGMKESSKKSTLLFNLQEGLFYFGIFSFIAWHVLEMYLTK